jgi:hypothetical protein
MAFFFRKCVLVASAGFIFTSCTKSSNHGGKGDTTPPTADSTVYIAGNNGVSPILWKNGIPDTLSPTIGDANQIFVSGNDIYVAGSYQHTINTHTNVVQNGPDIGQYVYWKNGIPNNVDTPQENGIVPSVSVSGTDVYFTNFYGWKNGTMIDFPGEGIPGKNFTPTGIICTFAEGADVYFAGYDTLGNGVYWKNGDMTIAAPYGGRGTTQPLVYCMYVSSNNVYVGGFAVKGVYWLNGTAYFMQPRPNDGSFLSSINSLFVDGTDVYNPGGLTASGQLMIGFPSASYWKNGVEVDLQTNNPPPSANVRYWTTSVFVSGSDVYVSGLFSTSTIPSAPTIDSAVYWKNGVEYSLHTPGIAYSIFVK